MPGGTPGQTSSWGPGLPSAPGAVAPPTAIGAITHAIAKPFSYPELRGRVGALLRRADRRRRVGRVRVGALQLDAASRTVLLGGRPVALTQKEFALLRVLAAEPTKVHSKDELLRTVWGFRARGTTRTLDSHACRLRAKLGVDGDRFVLNVWGVGYRLVDGPGVDVDVDVDVGGDVDAAVAGDRR